MTPPAESTTIGPDVTTSVELNGDGAVVIVKRPTTVCGVERVRHEAALLDVARHPGVVELLASTDEHGHPAITTGWVGPRTLADHRLLPLVQTAGIMAALCDSVADLHEFGVAHGAIGLDHVIVAPDGRPVLCGFGRGRLVSGDDRSGQAAMADDVADLGCLLRTLAGADVELEPIPKRRPWRRASRWQGYQRRALLTLADQATHDDRHVRPTARKLAAAIHDTIPEARVTPIPTSARDGSSSEFGSFEVAERPSMTQILASPAQSVRIGDFPAPPPPRPAAASSRRRTIVGASVGVLAVIISLLVLGDVRPGRHRGQRAATAVPSRPTVPAAPPISRPSGRVGPNRGCPAPVRPRLDVDGDGCPDPIRLVGTDVVAKGVRYSIGRAGDRITIGDWHCNGHATPAVLRPSTGEVFVFSDWAARNQPITVRATTRVGHGASIEAVDTDDGCSELRVRTTAQHVVVVPTGPRRPR